MNWIPDFIKELPEIIKAASATELSLAAAIVIAGVVAVMYLMRNVVAGYRLAALIIWLVIAAFILWLNLDDPAKRSGYKVRVIGQESQVVGNAVDLDLGFIPAGEPVVTRVSVVPPVAVALRAETAESTITAALATNQGSPQPDGGILSITVKSETDADTQFGLIRVVPDQRGVPALAVHVRYRALPATAMVEKSSGPKASGRGKDFSNIYSVCAAAPIAGAYRVVSSREWLTGDRVCNAWSTCTPRREADGSGACLDFTLQGHDECSGDCAIRNSEGHVSARFALQSPTPRVSTRAN